MRFSCWFLLCLVCVVSGQQVPCHQAWVGAGTGAWYRVDTNCSVSNFYKTSLIYSLPKVFINATSGDGVYCSLGIYESVVGNGADVGLLYQNSKWYSYAASESSGWLSGTISINPTQNPSVQLDLTIISNTSVLLEVYDAASHQFIGKDVFEIISKQKPIWKLNPSGYQMGFYRFDSIAQNKETLTSGSFLEHSKVSNWVVFSKKQPSTPILISTEWTAIQNRGFDVGPCCSEAEKATITVHNQSEYSTSDISIHY